MLQQELLFSTKGVLVQNNAIIYGLTLYLGLYNYPSSHTDDVIYCKSMDKTQFRNIWIKKTVI
jgi:hypothetical protein